MLMIVVVQRVWSPWLAAPPIGVMVSDTSKDIVTLNQFDRGYPILDEETNHNLSPYFNYISRSYDPELER